MLAEHRAKMLGLIFVIQWDDLVECYKKRQKLKLKLHDYCDRTLFESLHNIMFLSILYLPQSCQRRLTARNTVRRRVGHLLSAAAFGAPMTFDRRRRRDTPISPVKRRWLSDPFGWLYKNKKLSYHRGTACNKHLHSTMTRSSRFYCLIGVIKAELHYTDTDTDTDPHGPNGVSPQKSPSPCPCPCSGI